MSRIFRWLALIAGGLLLVVCVGAGVLFSAATVVPAEYEEALRIDEGQHQENRKELETELATLYTEAQDAKAWQTVLTADQINGWLATQLPEDYPELAEQGLTNPRVVFSPDGATLAIRIEQGRVNGVASAKVQGFLAGDGRLALQLVSVRLGRLPLPLGQAISQLQAIMADSKLPLQWTQSEGLPVLLVDIEQIASSEESRRWLTGVEIREGQIALAGATKSLDLPLPPESAPDK